MAKKPEKPGCKGCASPKRVFPYPKPTHCSAECYLLDGMSQTASPESCERLAKAACRVIAASAKEKPRSLRRKRYLVYSYDPDADGGQVMVDVVMATSTKTAVSKVARGRDYAIVDGADLLDEVIKGLIEQLALPPEQIDQSWKEIIS